ncbi:MAG: hypothetical protein Q3986_08080 [Akkermansia sp.]|nr:hypothetical protein [Akkermansia sp.]
MNIRVIEDTAETCPLFPFEKPQAAESLKGYIAIDAKAGLMHAVAQAERGPGKKPGVIIYAHESAYIEIPLTASRDAINDFMREHERDADEFERACLFAQDMQSCLDTQKERQDIMLATRIYRDKAVSMATKAIDRIATAASSYDWETPPVDDMHFHYTEEGVPDRPLRDEEDPWEIDRTPERNGYELVTMLTSVRYAVEYGTDEVADEFTAAQRRAIRDFSRKYTTPDLAKSQNGRDCSVSFDTCDITGERGECATYWVYPEAKLRREIRKRERAAAATANGKETQP